MIDQASLVTAPGDNLEGVRSAFEQIELIREPGWTIDYDRRTDTMFLRAPQYDRVVSYFLPSKPEIIFELDATSGQLVGVDIEDIWSRLAREDSDLRAALIGFAITTALGQVPGFRHMMALLRRGVQSVASDNVERQAKPLKSLASGAAMPG
jgi:hypothetical protein